MTESRPEVSAGMYRHFKGGLYEVVGVARHSETDEELVIYRPQYGARGLWARPRAMFLEMVGHDGRTVPRFRYVGPSLQAGLAPAEGGDSREEKRE